MTSRPRAAKTAEPAAKPAKKATTQRTTGATGRTPRKRTPRKAAAPALSLVKNKPTPEIESAGPQTDTRPRLTVRRKLFVGPMGPSEQAAIRAALDSARLRLPVPVRTWNGSQAKLTDGTLLIHNPGPDRYFTAHIACRHGAIHGHPIASYRDLVMARDTTAACETRHSEPTVDDNGVQIELDWDKAITRGVGPLAKPKPSAVFQLREGVRRAEAAKADTQPLPKTDITEATPGPLPEQQERALADTLAHSGNATDETQPMPKDDIAEGLAARAAEQPADTDQTREHPQP